MKPRWIIDPEVERIFFCLCAHSVRCDPIPGQAAWGLGPYWLDGDAQSGGGVHHRP